MSQANVMIRPDGSVPIPSEIQIEIGLAPPQTVLLRVEGQRLILEKPRREEVVREIERLCAALRSGESLSAISSEIEAGREGRE